MMAIRIRLNGRALWKSAHREDYCDGLLHPAAVMVVTRR